MTRTGRGKVTRTGRGNVCSIRVEGRRPVGRPRRIWLESVEADIT